VILATAILLTGIQSAEAKAAAKLGKELSQIAAQEGAKPTKTYILFTKPKPTWKLSTKPDEQLDSEGMWREDVEGVGTVWPKAKVGTFVSMAYSSPSGDWFASEDYSLRADGTLAVARVQFSSFNPFEFRRTETRLVSKAGKTLSTKLEYTDFDAKPLTKAQIKELGEVGKEYKLRKSAKELPFAIR
jgi:hypothetical protein